MSYEIVEKLKKEIAAAPYESGWEEIGEVISSTDGIIKVSGLTGAGNQEVLLVSSQGGDVPALSLNLEEEMVGALVLGPHEGISAGDRVKRTGEVLSLFASEEVLGRVITPLGEPVDGAGPLFKKTEPTRMYLEAEAPSVVDRESVSIPLHTGIKAIDAMVPIGRGQRELIIGDRQTGKTALALDTIINQQKDPAHPAVCVYVSIGQREAKISKLVETLRKFDALRYSVVVSAPASSPAAYWYLAPFAGCAVGEYFRNKGKDAVVIYDDLSKHAWAYRQISLLLRRPPGREAYPGDVFYLHSRLLERAAKLSKEKGGGSLTALPIIETQLGDVTAYIPTNVISITDGQIYLEQDLFNQGVRPAINAGLSVSRVGSNAQTKAMKKVAGKLRLALAQFRELASFVQFASDVDEATKKRIGHGRAITEILKQPDLSPLPFEKQVALFYATLNHYFDDIPAEKVTVAGNAFLDYLEKMQRDSVLEPIKKTKALDDAVEVRLKEAIEKFMALYR